MIELKRLHKTFTQKGQTFHALEDISLTISEGECHGIIGQSGAGKSTLLRTINLLERPTSGKVIVDHCELSALSEEKLQKARQNIAMIFQHFNLINNKNVFDNVALPFLIKKEPINKEHVLEMLNVVGLEDKIHHYPTELSGGQKQRVAIARALIQKPKVLLCDEATSALDPAQSEKILELLQTVQRDFKLTLVLVTHQMEVIKTLCQSVSVIEKGKLVSSDKISNLLASSELEHQFIDNLKPELPSYLKANLQSMPQPGTNPLVRIIFSGDIAQNPILSELSQALGIKFNLLQANFDAIGGQTYGIANIELMLGERELDKTIEQLQSSGLSVEVLGYV